MHSSYFTPKEKMAGFLKDPAMNSQEGIFLSAITDRSIQRLLPPPLELADAERPILYLYIVNIREPTFAPWYMEGGIGVFARYKEKTGVYFFNLQLSGPGALMGAFTGREGSGLPKKLCERIVVERTDEYGHCYIERNGIRLVDVELKIGAYNHPGFYQEQEKAQAEAGGILLEGGCLLHKYHMDSGIGINNVEIIYYDSPTRYYSWEPALATVKLASSIDDPWGEIPLISVLGAGWSVCDNFVRDMSTIYRYRQEDSKDIMQYLFAGRYDRSLLCKSHQRYP